MGHCNTKTRLMQEWINTTVMILLQIFIEDTSGTKILNSAPVSVNIYKEFLRSFPDYHIIFHFDNSTAEKMNMIIRQLKTDRFKLLLNYKATGKGTSSMELYPRPPGYKMVHIVFLKHPLDFRYFSSVNLNIDYRDIILFLSDDKDFHRKYENEYNLQEKIWDQDGEDRASGLFILNLSNGTLYYCCHYCGPRSGKLNLIGTADKKSGLNSHINSYSNFHGYHFQIGYVDFPPVFSCRRTKGGCEPEYPEGYLLATLSSYLNFTFNLVEFNDKNSPDGPWRTMIVAVYQKEIDWAIGGITITQYRSEITDFTRHIKNQGFAIVFAIEIEEDIYTSTMAIIRIFFSWRVLLFTSACSVLISFIINRSRSLYGAHKETWFFYWMVLIKSLWEQPVPNFSRISERAVSARCIFIIWCLLTICITSTYRSLLTTSMIAGLTYEAESVNELLEQGYTFQVSKTDWSALEEKLQSSSDEVYRRILEKSADNLGICEAAEYILHNKATIIEEELPLEYRLNKECLDNKYITRGQIARMRLTKKKLFSEGHHAWSLQLSSPFKERFLTVIGRLDDAGIIDHWYSTVSNFKLPKSNQQQKQIDTYVDPNTRSFMSAMLIYIICIVISSIAFITEIFYYKLQNRFK